MGGRTARHARLDNEVLGEEKDVHADEKNPEMQLAQELAVHPARHLREPVIEAGEEREDRAQRQHIVEVRDDIIGVVQVRIDAAVGEYDAGHAADGEHEDEAERSEEHTSELQSLMRISYAVFCLNKKKQ